MSNNKNKFYAVDLFAGPGGLGEGFSNAGFDVIVSVDKDPWACATLRTRAIFRHLRAMGKTSVYWDYVRETKNIENIYAEVPEIGNEIQKRVLQETITPANQGHIAGEIIKRVSSFGISEITVLLGGPPCQLYSPMGRARYSPMKDKFYRDPRRRLFEQYLFFLKVLKPKVFVFENVPGIITAQLKRQNIIDMLQEGFSKAGYVLAKPSGSSLFPDIREYVLNSAEFSIPQERRRLIIIGFREEFAKKFPKIMHIYEQIRKQAMDAKRFTVRDALADLPAVQPGKGENRWFGHYGNSKFISEYAVELRRESEGILNHRARTHMESDLERYRYFIQRHANGNGAADLKQLLIECPSLAPAHKNLSSFLDRFKVQWWDRPSSTITSHLAKDGHYYIHPDVNQCRSFTVREAARCQSFPDTYLFEGPRTEQFKQIGNAVPPLLAYEIASTLFSYLKSQ